MNKKIIIKIIMILFFISFIICVYLLSENFIQFKKSESSNLELIENVIIEENKMDNNEDSSYINWPKLKEISKDIIGWIKIDGTNINYPILSDVENSLYYLNHSYDGDYNKNGSIFTTNKNPFNDSKTILHGHNMKNEIMFSELSKYMNKSFFDEHPNFEIYTENTIYKASIFSCYSIGINDEENNIKDLDFVNEMLYYKKASKYSIENVENIEKIVKLSTCSYLNNRANPTTQRYYIVAKLEIIDNNN